MTANVGRSLWADAWLRLWRDRLAMASLCVIVLYSVVALLALAGWIAPWKEVVGGSYQPPSGDSLATFFGTDLFGRSVFYKTIHGTRIAMSVGLVSSLISVPIGVVLGAVAGYFGKWVDDVVVWLYTTLSSIPNIMLLIAIAFVLGKGIFSIYIALGVTAWVSLARVIRGEFIKHKEREYVVAAEGLGAGHFSRIVKHILPNVFHFVIIHLSIQFMAAIKAEVILSFLGLGVQGQPSWGVMIDDAKLELARGVWWQLAGATFGMFFVVLAFNVLGDALRDALDPKVK
ncbi:MAG: peptide ABC transporter permease [Bdellovibrionales bacterium GWB1_55_8]|nr:MAG: peptide ABC transporter permease [Bdellovibrionales bacterium GWB1_55_8]